MQPQSIGFQRLTFGAVCKDPREAFLRKQKKGLRYIS